MFNKVLTFIDDETAHGLCKKIAALKNMANQEIEFSTPSFGGGKWVTWFSITQDTMLKIQSSMNQGNQEKQEEPKKKSKK